LKEELEIAVTHELPMTNYTSVSPTTSIQLDLSETSSACPIKMGDGEISLPIVPFTRWWHDLKRTHGN